MKRQISPVAGLAMGVVVGAGAILALGAAQVGRTSPRYTVATTQSRLMVTDNELNKFYLYDAAPDPEDGFRVKHYRLRGTIDLTQLGASELPLRADPSQP